MTKYTDEEIIAYLKTLREGDVLTAVRNEDIYYTKGATYAIQADEDGDLYVKDNDDNYEYVKIGEEYDREIADYLAAGIFGIPTPAVADKPFTVDITSYTIESGTGTHSIEIQADGFGLARLFELEAQGNKSRNLSELYARRTRIQTEIDRLEAK